MTDKQCWNLLKILVAASLLIAGVCIWILAKGS